MNHPVLKQKDCRDGDRIAGTCVVRRERVLVRADGIEATVRQNTAPMVKCHSAADSPSRRSSFHA
jgi:hypothetical protein